MLAWPAWTRRFNRLFPLRYASWALCALLAVLFTVSWTAGLVHGALALLFIALTLLGLRDARQQRHSILRNYPVIGHLRFLFEFIRPEIRQYFLEGDNDAAPFSRAQRSIVYQRAKGDPDQRPFGTQLDVGQRGYEWINHSLAPTHLTSHDFRITIGAGRAQPYSCSVFNISAMSFGALSANAILALNRGAKLGGFAHDTGEGSISAHHRVHGGDLIWEIGSGYFGCRNDDGSFSADRFAAAARDPQVKMIELKLSQGGQAGPRRRAARPQGDGGDRGRARRARGRGLHLAGAPQRVRDAGGDDEVHRAAARAVGWQAHRLQALHRPPVGVVRAGQGDAGDRHHAGLHRRRRCRGRHRRGAAGVHQLRRRAAAGGAAAGAQHAGRPGPAGQDQDRLRRQGDHGLRHRAADGAGRRLVQRRPRLHVRAGLHPGAGLPHRPLPHRRDHARPGTPARAGRAGKAQRVANFHQNTLKALKELVEAAGLCHPQEITAQHIVHRLDKHEVRLLANLIPFVEPGALLRGELPHATFRIYWPLASAQSFAAQGPIARSP